MSSKYNTFVHFQDETCELGMLSVGALFALPSKQTPEDLRRVTAVDKTESYHRANNNPDEQTQATPSDTPVVPILVFGTIQSIKAD